MNIKARLKKLEDEILRSGDYYKGKAIMEKIVELEDQGDSSQTLDLLTELHSMNNTKKHIYPK